MRKSHVRDHGFVRMVRQSQSDDHFSSCLARPKQFQPLKGAVEGQDVGDIRRDADLSVPAHQGGEALGEDFGAEIHVAAPVEPDHCQVFHQEVVGGNLRHLARREADGEETAFGAGGAKGGGPLCAANGVIDDISSAECFEGCAQVGRFCINEMIGPGCGGDGEFVGTARAGDDTRPHQFAQFNGGEADATRSSGDEKGLAGLQTGPMIEREMGGAISDLEGGGIGMYKLSK